MGYKVNGKEVGDIGFGLLGLTMRAKPIPEEQAFASLKAALDCGCNYWNAAEFYGPPDNNSLTLLAKYFARYPEDASRVVLNVKGAIRTVDGLHPDGSPAFVAESVENCLRMLGPAGRIDEFELARRDADVPYEESVLAIANFVERGGVGGVACSEIGASTLRKAVAVTKITSVEVELSLWHTEPLTNGVAAVCAELGIPMIAYSPLGRGFLTGQKKSPDDIEEGDWRRILPRFSRENFPANLRLVTEIEKLAARKGCTPAQIAVNWVRAVSRRPGMPAIIPIPGAAHPDRVRENATIIELTDEDLAEIDGILAGFEVKGDRYHEHGMGLLDKDA